MKEAPLDGLLPGIRCPNCEALLPRGVADLRRAPEFTCAECGATACILLDTSRLDAAADSINQAAARGERLRA